MAPVERFAEEKSLPGKCGIVGVYSPDHTAAHLARTALAAIQHRGQESAGIASYQEGRTIGTHTGMGLVPHVLSDQRVHELSSRVAIAHDRYSTTGDSVEENAQPVTMIDGSFWLSVAHNGNLINQEFLMNVVQTPPPGTSDTAYMVAFLLQERKNYASWHETFEHELPKLSGAYSLVMLTEDGSLYAGRDPQEVRPLSIGRLSNGWAITSETVALDSIGAKFVRHVKGGELIRIDETGTMHSSFFGVPSTPKRCILENIYFSRPDSFLDGTRVRRGREESGVALAGRLQDKKINPDLVVPILDSGQPAAKGVAKTLDIPLEEAITTSHYVGRTFIMPGQQSRISGVNGKHNIVPDDIAGKHAVFVDDSAVRLNTSTKISDGLTIAGVAHVDAAFASPPIVEKCDLGVDMKGKRELPASKWADEPLETIEKHIADLIHAESVTYLPIEQTAQSFGEQPEHTCHFCFGGPHPVREQSESFRIRERQIDGKAKLMVLASGGGTNLQQLIDGTIGDDIDGEIVSVVSNIPDAYALTRAQNHDISTAVVPSKGKLKDPELRKKFEEELFSVITQRNPDIIICAGWMVVLGDEFIQKVAALEIPIINLHPALLTPGNRETIMTSRGRIPVVRGAHAIKDAFEKNLPVSGVTVHQVLPGPFDTGPVILKEEVARSKDDTMETWEQKIHETEYRVLPTAVKRVIHVMKHGIDVSDGTFPW